MAVDLFCLFKSFGFCKDPPIEEVQPCWWKQVNEGTMRDPFDLRETPTEIQCIQPYVHSSTIYNNKNGKNDNNTNIKRINDEKASSSLASLPTINSASSTSSSIPPSIASSPSYNGYKQSNNHTNKWNHSSSSSTISPPPCFNNSFTHVVPPSSIVSSTYQKSSRNSSRENLSDDFPLPSREAVLKYNHNRALCLQRIGSSKNLSAINTSLPFSDDIKNM